MANQVENTAPQVAPGQSGPMPSPISGEHIAPGEIAPGDIQHAIAAQVIIGVSGALPSGNENPLGINPNVSQSQITITPITQGMQQQAMQPTPVIPLVPAPGQPPSGHSYAPYQPFYSAPAQPTPATQAIQTGAAPSILGTPAPAAAVGTQPSMQSQTATAPSAPLFSSSAASPQTPTSATPQPLFPTQPASAHTPATQVPSAQASTQLPTASQPATAQQPLQISALLSPSQPNLQSGSLANHIQNLLASMISSNNSSQTLIQHQALVNSPVVPSGTPLVEQTPPSTAKPHTSTAVATPHERAASESASAERAATDRATQSLSNRETAQREGGGSKDTTTRADNSPQPPAQSPSSGAPPPAPPASNPSSNAALDAALRAIAPSPSNSAETTPRTSPPPPPEARESAAGSSTTPPQQSPSNTQLVQPASGVTTQVPPQQSSILIEARPETLAGPRQTEPNTQLTPHQRDGSGISPNLRSPVDISIQPSLLKVEPLPVAQPNQQHERQIIERLRDIQQILAVELGPTRPTSERISRDSELRSPEHTLSEHRERTSVAVERVRESILDKLTSMQNRIETAATERQQRRELLGPLDSHIQGRDTLVRPDPIHHDAKPSLLARLAERLHENQQISRVTRDSLTGVSSVSVAERARLRHLDATSPLTGPATRATTQRFSPTRPDSERFSNLIDLLKRFSERSINFRLLNKMDTSLEKACLTVATGAALGFVGLELLYRAANVAVLHTLRLLREKESDPTEQASENPQTELENLLQNDLEEFTASELATVGEQGFVVDLAGVVLTAHTETPLAKVEVNCSEFGSCLTDFEGRFLFPNIPLGTPYTITISSAFHKLKPLVVTGICGELEFLRIKAERL
jgi:hypothetical protein